MPVAHWNNVLKFHYKGMVPVSSQSKNVRLFYARLNFSRKLRKRTKV